ncbi:threonine ammonia-lyase [Phenylobacterium sp.]|uniref:threonine ammonia-lyase n=1 Tax=Phenylobacterium sp. TaxID=1871053 RepID=UPI003D29CA7B
MSELAISFADVEAAADRLKGVAVETPLVESPALNERLGLQVLLKLETLQRVGAFKFRGAYNRLVQLNEAERKVGVVAFSSGNHAQGVALAAKLLGMPALIVMPADAPKVKADATRGYGAEVKFYDRLTESREKIAAAIAAERGAVMVPAFDDPHIIAGQGTAGLELVRQAAARGVNKLDVVITPCSGGGLLAGVATAVKALSPSTALIGAEPAGYDDTLKSLQAGVRTPMTPTHRTLCDALETPCPGELTFPIVHRNVSDVAVVTDAEVAEAVRYAFSVLKLVVEPGGAAGLAALLAGKVNMSGGKTVGLVLSGGNIDPDQMGQILRGEL